MRIRTPPPSGRPRERRGSGRGVSVGPLAAAAGKGPKAAKANAAHQPAGPADAALTSLRGGRGASSGQALGGRVSSPHGDGGGESARARGAGTLTNGSLGVPCAPSAHFSFYKTGPVSSIHLSPSTRHSGRSARPKAPAPPRGPS
ncbi:uncharacterized protein LOC124903470 [Homo sapiens]|uniref:uncharacterized protein LOC124903470 n=1 Tax=Homo sapiens TaxID=9606 RepID=UPI0000DD82A6|nr:uncharacterized protein LOC124903470 [Homo sapiens]